MTGEIEMAKALSDIEAAPADLIPALQEAVGGDRVIVDESERRFYSTDVYRAGELPAAVVRPRSVEELQAAVRTAYRHGVQVVPRGGGASYTDGYLPVSSRSISIDMGGLDRIVEINEEDMYVTVEAGCTWARLYEALKEKGLRTPFWGPFSGLHATVGGSMSQGSVSFGTGNYGASADSLLGLEVVVGDGRLVRTGTWGSEHGTPFFRHFGPDLAGLFTGDTGAMGIKARITLRLLKRPAAFVTCSFGFPDFASMAAGMQAVARHNVAAMNFGLDPRLQQGQLGKTSTADALSAAGAVFRTARNPVDGVVQVGKMAVAGRRFLKDATFSAHFIVEGATAGAAKSDLALVRSILGRYGAEVANTIPNVVMATPFMPFYNVLGPAGERWVPIHGLLPFSRAEPFKRDLDALYERYADRMREHKVDKGAMFMTITSHVFLYEPVFYWPDAQSVYHERIVPADYRESLAAYPPNPEGAALVEEMKHAIIDLFHQHGAAHFKIGKLYPYLRGRHSETVDLLRSVKSAVDPEGLINPGSLGL
jgi:FAD/FMN-containing dehydrogenase